MVSLEEVKQVLLQAGNTLLGQNCLPISGAGSAGKYLSSLLGVTNPQDEQFVNANDDEEHIDPRNQSAPGRRRVV